MAITGRRAGRNPSFPGSFAGAEIHSHYYIDPADPVDCVDKNVVIVGMGNSALDIACELSRAGIARNVYLSVRRGYYFIPKYFGGDTLDAGDPHPSTDPPLRYRLTPGWWQRGGGSRRSGRWSAARNGTDCRRPTIHTDRCTRRSRVTSLIRLGSGDVQPIANIAERSQGT